MTNFLNKGLNFIENKIKEFREDRKTIQRRKNTINLRKSKSSDYKRWTNPKELFQDWNERTAILGAMVSPGAIVIEFGAGTMSLKDYLPKNCNYTPSDIYSSSPEILVCDLNKPIPFDLLKYDTAVFSGVLEYIYDLDSVFDQFQDKIGNIILSYACSDISNANRLNRGWLSDYTKQELLTIFKKYHYQIVEYKEWRNQSIFKLVKS